MNTPDLLRPLEFPLHGSRLIEASAGTGKTFTLAALYLRLVLGHGGEAAFPRPLSPPEILVVTFTDAATKELRDRIRARLAEAADRFLDDPAGVTPLPPGTDLLHDLRAQHPPHAWPACARRLRLAAEWMDEAAVSTIHGWCNRMLREHAFDCGSLFTQTLETDAGDLLAEVVRDYWRTFCYPLAPVDARAVQGWWPAPDDLRADVGRLLALCDSLDAGRAPAHALQQARTQAATALAALKAPWQAWADELLDALEAAIQARHVPALQLRSRRAWLGALRDWAGNEAAAPALSDTAWERLTPAGLAKVWHPEAPPLEHPALHDLVTLPGRIAGLPQGREDLLCHAAHWVAGRLASEQRRRAQMGFNDLLTGLDSALPGPNGAQLAALIRRQFPVALIDEFQDTDPLQYRIFDAIYRVALDAPDTCIVLIGDPKQAIYAFRGADIHTYLAARSDTAGRHATLGTNFRSTGPMVDAVNHVFRRAEQRAEGHGAFLFRDASGNRLPFLPMQARGRAETWCIDAAPAPALTCWFIESEAPLGSGSHTDRMATHGAGEIVRLLNLGQQGRAGFRAPGLALRPLRPGDIAVLVNNGHEAGALRRALSARGVRSVYLSDKDSVFASAVPADLQHWLSACAEPDDDRRLRAALGTALLGLSWSELDRLNHDELHWEERVLQFRGYRQLWRRQGVLPMLRRLLNDFDVPARLLAREDERTLTDLLHLAELLQQASVEIEGEHALIRHLAEQRRDVHGDGDSRLVRLESDADLVKVVTVHKSKGLEYPLVFLPFASAVRRTKADDLPLKWHDERGHLRVSLHADDAARAHADRERLGEDLRKLYVALTRARFATWVGVATLKDSPASALGYLLTGGTPVAPGTLESTLIAFKGDCAAIAVQPAPSPGDAIYRAEARAAAACPELPLPAPRAPWWIASYSALRTEDAGEDPAAPGPHRSGAASAAEETYQEGRFDRPPAEDAAPPPRGAPAGGALHGFPRGAGPGTFLHGLLEWVGRQGFAAVHAEPADLADLIARRCNLQGWSHWTAPLRDWLLAWLVAPLPLGHGASTRPVDLQATQVEMEFWFPATGVETRALDALVCAHTMDRAPRAPLQADRLNGMLKGYIDLVFEHRGRYYVADYKSNWLGPHDDDYGPAALRAAILQHRYELQYVLYVFALHRLLRSRLPDYDYDRHVGGAVYLFLRGHAAAGGGVHLERPAKALIEQLERLFTAAAAVDPEALA